MWLVKDHLRSCPQWFGGGSGRERPMQGNGKREAHLVLLLSGSNPCWKWRSLMQGQGSELISSRLSNGVWAKSECQLYGNVQLGMW